MKGSNVLKKLWLPFSLLLTLPLTAESALENYLSREKNLILDYQEEANRLESAVLRKSWINPIMLNYTENTSTISLSGDETDRVFNVGINQPIFKSGGIYYAVKFADAKAGATQAQIRLQRRQLISQAIETLFQLKKNRLQQRQMRLKIRNDAIDIRRKKEQYDAGVIDSSFLNEAILQRNQDRTSLLALQLAEKNLRNAFSLLSDKRPDGLRLPRLTLIKAGEYRRRNLELETQRLLVAQSEYNSKMTWAKYLPTLSLSANYYDTDSDRPMPGQKDNYYRYGFQISMPLSINAPQDIEAGRVRYLQQAVQLQDARRKVASEYRLVLDTLAIIDKKIALARSDQKLYRSLLQSTKEQAAAGQKTRFDVETMRNAMNMAKLDAQIYGIERQIQLLKLYGKIHE
ncbi:TolC family protein [Nitratifractor sp.]|uniref:TolC family protein n=1 Tax=Nitratifractor sp. TaxID=2268144 RepID=UPI0025FAD672|nr:TolC family protein [Nitratifractor sp.]